MTETRFKPPALCHRCLFENASDAIWFYDRKGHIVYANRASADLTGYTRTELKQKNLKDLLTTASEYDQIMDMNARMAAGAEVKMPYEQKIRRHDGSVAVLRMATTLVKSADEVLGFQNIARDITEELRRQQSMKSFVQDVIRAQEAERKRISRELHDEVAPLLLLLMQKIDNLGKQSERDIADCKPQLDALRSQSEEALESLRRIAQDLRPRILDDLGLIPALEWLTEKLAQDGQIHTESNIKGREVELTAEIQLLIFRIAQEAFNNIRKHSLATWVRLELEFKPKAILLTIQDNGKGFNLSEQTDNLAQNGKLGLAGMHERAQLIGGHIHILTHPGQGTTVIAEVPTINPDAKQAS
ncbi:PAS domain-containing sensor histidine kinase [Dehalococcoides mccartyi]|uniref:PAS domain-containing sensor histidine kinase n=1 Tax=Dehalococcoides mccartyi TaxID=61435 RepID=UPI00398B5292